MRVPNNTPLVAIARANEERRYGLDMGMIPQVGAQSAAAFGEASAVGYGAVGKGLGDMGSVLAGVAADIQRREDETRALEAYNQLNERVGVFLNGDGSPESGLYNRRGAAVAGSSKDTRRFFTQNLEELSGNLSPNAARMFTAKADELRFSEQRKVTAFEAEARRQWAFETQKLAAKGEMGAANDNFDSPVLRQEAIERGKQNIARMGQMRGDSPEAIANLQRGYAAEVLLAGAKGLMDKGDYVGAMTVAQDPQLSPEQRQGIMDTAKEAIGLEAQKEKMSKAFAVLSATEPDQAMAKLQDPDFIEYFDLTPQELKEISGMYRTRQAQNAAAQRQARQDYELGVAGRALGLALGAGEVGVSAGVDVGAPAAPADPVAAYRLIADSELDEAVKAGALAGLAAGTFGKTDDPAAVNALAARIATDGDAVSEAEILGAVLVGAVSAKSKDKLLELKKLAAGPHKNLVRSADMALERVLGVAAGTGQDAGQGAGQGAGAA